MLYQKNEIITMAIVYEGHLPQGYTLDKRELASEIIDRAHQSGLSSEIKLSLHTAIRAQRANESAYYAGSYKPTDDLPSMLQDCIKDVRENMIANGEIPGPMPMKSMQFKSWSSVASTVWVGIHITREGDDMPKLEEKVETGNAHARDLIQDLADADFVQHPQGEVAYATQIAFQAKDNLIAAGKAVVPAVLDCLTGQGPSHQRAMAAQVLGEIGDSSAVKALIIKLRDSEMLVRGFSAEALGKIGDERALSPLRDMLNRPEEANMVKAHAQGALNRLGYVEKKLDKIKLWKQIYWLGVFILLPGCLMAALVLLTWSDTNVAESDWSPIIGCIGTSIGLGWLLMYLASRPVKPGDLEKRLYKTKTWIVAFGVLMLVFGLFMLFMGIVTLTSSELKVAENYWLSTMICAGTPITSGLLFIFLATRSSKKNQLD